MDNLPQSRTRRSEQLRVLVVDDDLDSAEVLSVVLEQEGMEVCIALKAAEALALVEEFTPDIAILDIGLPAFSGYQLIAALRADERLSQCRFIAVTGYSGDDLAARSARAGFERHLTKPVSPLDLIRLLLGDANDVANGG